MFTGRFSRQYCILSACIVALGWALPSRAEEMSFKVPLSGAEEVPPVQAAARGAAKFDYDPANRIVKWTITFSGLSGPATMAHLHGPAQKGEKAPVVLWLSKQGSPADSPISGQGMLTPEQAEHFSAGRWYVNIHTQANPGGEIRGQIPPASERGG